MKAMILAAGLGTRMRPLSDLLAKPALPVLNRPLLHHTLERLARQGVREVVINLHHLPDTVERAARSGRPRDLRVHYSREPVLLGSGGGPRQARRFFGNEPALIVNGDCLFDFDLRALMRRHLASGASATLVLRPNPDRRLYPPVVTGPRGWVRAIRGLPLRARGAASLFTGVQIVSPALLDRLPRGPSDIVRDLYSPLLGEGARLLGVRVRGQWRDLGTPESYRRVQVGLAAHVRGRTRSASVVARSVKLGQAATIVRSVVGEQVVIGAAAHIRSSVVWPGARVGAGARVSASILTSDACVAPGERVHGRIVLGRGRLPLA